MARKRNGKKVKTGAHKAAGKPRTFLDLVHELRRCYQAYSEEEWRKDLTPHKNAVDVLKVALSDSVTFRLVSYLEDDRQKGWCGFVGILSSVKTGRTGKLRVAWVHKEGEWAVHFPDAIYNVEQVRLMHALNF